MHMESWVLMHIQPFSDLKNSIKSKLINTAIKTVWSNFKQLDLTYLQCRFLKGKDVGTLWLIWA